METGALGNVFSDGEVIIHRGDIGDCMYEILDGQVEVLREREGKEIHFNVLSKGDFFGEMAIFEREERSATVRALGEVRVLTIDKKSLLRRISMDPSLAFRLLEKLSHRIREFQDRIE